jgi:pyruvate dehydrogenase E2 component (dihydrolipoamide acetyltransferase)
MTQPVTMPALSDTMGAGRLVKWTKKVGDKIKKGDVIAEVETDKAVMEVEAFEDGYLSGPLAVEGTEAPVGDTIGYITDSPGQVSGAKGAAVPRPAGGDGRQAATPVVSETPVSAVLAASLSAVRPAVRPHPRPSVSASAGGEAVARTGRARRDVAPAIAAGPPYRLERASSLREAVARNMIASASIPSFHVSAQLPLQPMMSSAQTHHYSLSLLLARACALTIAAHPLFNAAYTPDGLARRERVDIGVAFDTGEGLITPVLRDAAGRSLPELSEDWNRLRERANNRRLAPADYSGATFYLSDLGVYSVVHDFDSIIPNGACAILSVAAAGPQGAFCTLTCDHRVVFGADAARFLQTLEQRLKDPERLLSEGSAQ